MKVQVKTPLEHDGQAFAVGAFVDLPKDVAAVLVGKAVVEVSKKPKPKNNPNQDETAKAPSPVPKGDED